MTAEAAIKQFLTDPSPHAIALHGKWGRGKTHLWKSLVRSTDNIPWKAYSYVSLFGINSLDELRVAIFEKTVPMKTAHQQNKVVSFEAATGDNGIAKSRLATIRAKAKGISTVLSRAETPWVGNIGPLYQALVFSQVREQLICIDDIERRGTNLRLLDVLGLVTFLCEERLCSVAVIMNDSSLEPEDLPKWHSHREKVFHGEIHYRPQVRHCIDLVLAPEGENEWHDAARPVLLTAEVSNVRILTRAKGLLDKIASTYPNLPSAVRKKLARSIALLTYCHNASGEGAPPIAWALKHSQFQPHHIPGSTDHRTAEQKKWDEILDSISFTPEEVDVVIGDLLEYGFLDSERFNEEIGKLLTRAQQEQEENEFERAWRAYHDSFDDDASEVIDKFRLAFSRSVRTINSLNANSAIALMRALKQEELADTFIEEWIESRRSTPEELQMHAVETFGPITDEKFRAAIEAAGRSAKKLPSLPEAVRILATRKGDSDLAIEALAGCEEEELFQLLKSSKDRNVKAAIRYMYSQHEGRDYVKAAMKKISNVLSRIAQLSELNRIRVRQLTGEERF